MPGYPPASSARHFDTWWKQEHKSRPGFLTFTEADLLSDDGAGFRDEEYPDAWTSTSPGLTAGRFRAVLRVEPGGDSDGVTVDIPLSKLNQVDGDEFSWQVPGQRAELATELIRSLPKELRRPLVPAPDVARAALARIGTPSGDLRDRLAAELRAMRGVDIPREAWDLSKLPGYLRITFRVLDDRPQGEPEVLAEGKDLAELRRRLRPQLRARLSAAADGITRSGLTSWDFDSLPREFSDGTVLAYPALADAGDTAAVRLFETQAAAAAAMRAGTRRLILLGVPSPVKSIAGGLTTKAKLALSHNPHGGVLAMFANCVDCAADYLIAEAGGPAWDRAGFERLRDAVRGSLHQVTAEVVQQAESALRIAHSVTVRLDDSRADIVAPAVADIRAQLEGLIYAGFATATGYRKLPDLTRYLRAMQWRLDKLPDNPARDAMQMAVVHRCQDAYQRAIATLPPHRRASQDVRAVGWMIEELRISLFAQKLGTSGPISENRVLAALDRCVGSVRSPAGA